MDDIETFGEEMDVEEPQWMVNNRLWFAEHQEVSRLKFSPAYLEGWVTTSQVPALPSDPEPDDAPLDIDILFASHPTSQVPERSFISTLDVAEVPDLERMGVGRLFSEDDASQKGSSSSSDSRRKYWTKEEEVALSRFLQEYSPHRKIPKAAWEGFSRELNRSQCSVTAKAQLIRKIGQRRSKGLIGECEKHQRKLTLEDMITQSLQHLPCHEGTKSEIVSTIESLFPSQLSHCVPRSPPHPGPKWRNSVKQILSSTFEKVPGRYALLPDCPVLKAEECITMQDFIVWALQHQCDTLQTIKAAIRTEFGKWLNETVNPDSLLCVWEKTLLKKLKQCRYIDHSLSATRFRCPKSR